MHYAIGVGSNLGDRRSHLDRGAALLAASVRIRTRSSLLENPAVGGPPGQGAYLNGVWVIETDLAPVACVARLLEVERRCGRERSGPAAPRTLDLDCLLADPPLQVASATVVLPHPLLHLRRFVMLPLLEVAADWYHPLLACRVRDIDPVGWQ